MVGRPQSFIEKFYKIFINRLALIIYTFFPLFSATFKGEVRLPDVVVFFHTKDGQAYIPHPAIIDCAKMAIATVGIVDTDCDPNLISYPIPGNDDSMISQELYIKLINEAILLGKQKRQEDGLAGNL